MNAPVDTVPAATNPREVWEALLNGNERFAVEKSLYPHQDLAYRKTLLAGQRPRACVFTCADSRVPVELLFDVGLGDIFVVRTAGEVLDNGVLASLEYAVSGLGVQVLVVLGHEFCGAVGAATSMVTGGTMLPSHQRVLIEQITPSVLECYGAGKKEAKEVESHHAKMTLEKIRQTSPLIADAITAGDLVGVAAHFELTTSKVTEVYYLHKEDSAQTHPAQ
ncbi:MAG: carbonic anhydrase [Corynebacterium sp.]|nr:carbonic anhydrase [Corynebacterium sp.]